MFDFLFNKKNADKKKVEYKFIEPVDKVHVFTLSNNPEKGEFVRFQADRNVILKIVYHKNHQILFGSTLSTLSSGFIESNDKNSLIDLEYIGITCTVHTWVVRNCSESHNFSVI